jgi:glycosyltransferase involved in cell wall biosynthesis/CelD/BcsL family acetyltransferase involved in cellulose biosynthesis
MSTRQVIPGKEVGADAAAVILFVAFPYAPVGPQAVGGAEVICSQLEAAVVDFGYASVVVGNAASSPQGLLYPTIVPPGPITDEVRAEVEARQQEQIDRALSENAIGLVHMHGLDFARYRLPEDLPVLVTLHLPPSWYPESIWEMPANYHFLCVSETQRAACPAGVRDRVLVVPNGVPLPDGALLRPEGRYALMLARICPEKNLHTGLDAAKLAGMPALLGGEVFPYEAHERYFAEELAPRLNASGVAHQSRDQSRSEHAPARFLGRVSGDEKCRALSRAACLLLPSLAPETSSLVAMEALSFGVPVIAMAVGAVPEIVEDGRTGFLIQPGPGAVQEMAAAIARVAELDRKVCRAAAEEQFASEKMLKAYASLYRALARPGQARCGAAVHAATAGPAPIQELQGHEVATSLLRSGKGLEELAADWQALWGEDSNTTPFQHPAWLLPWWRQFGPDGELQAITQRDPEGRLTGLLPLYTYRDQGSGRRQLLLVGAGTSDYLNGVWRDGQGSLARAALQQAISVLPDWEDAALTQVRRTTCLAVAANTLGLQIGKAEPTSFIDVAKSLPPKIRANVRRYRRLAAAEGVLECTMAATAAEAQTSFDELVRLHTERWQGRGEAGVLQDERVLAHHRQSLPLLLEAGLLCLFHLRLSGETLGVLYGLLDAPHARDRRLYLYLIGFSGRHAKLSPGSLLLDEAWQYAVRLGLSKLDLLRGGEEYKHLWGAEAEPTLALTMQQRAKAPEPALEAVQV